MPIEDVDNLSLPQSEAGCRRLLELLDGEIDVVRTLSEEIDLAEAALDDLVSSYYGVGDEAKEIIREYLRRF
jgi:hypothetical protein